MALSGTINGTTGNSHISAKLTWKAEQSSAGNYSDVTATLTYSRTNTGYTTQGTWSGGITINGIRTSGTKNLTITYNSNTVAMTVTTRVHHNSNGTKTITIKADGSISDTSLTSTTLSGDVTLNTIHPLSKPNLSANSVEFGKSLIIYTNRASTSYTHSLFFRFGNRNEELIASNVGASYTWTVPKTLMNSIPNSTSLSITISCYTYLGSELIGDTSLSFTAVVPTTTDCYPSISGIAWTKTSSEPANWPMTQGITTGKLDMTGVVGAWGSTISTYSLTFNGLSSTTSYLSVDNLASAGTFQAVAKVTDSRGRSYTKTVNFSVTAYTKPQLEVKVFRCDAQGNENATGEYLSVTASVEITNIANNSLKALYIQYKKSSDVSYSNADLYDGVTVVISASSDYTWSWVVTAKDVVSEVTRGSFASTGAVVLDILANGKGIAFGKVAEKEGFDIGINWPIMQQGQNIDYVLGTISTDSYTIESWASGKLTLLMRWTYPNLEVTTPWGSGFYKDIDDFITLGDGWFASSPDVFLSICGNGLRNVMVKSVTPTQVSIRVFDLGQGSNDATITAYLVGKRPM